MVLLSAVTLFTIVAQGSSPGCCDSTQSKELDHPRTLQDKFVWKVLTELDIGKIESKGESVLCLHGNNLDEKNNQLCIKPYEYNHNFVCKNNLTQECFNWFNVTINLIMFKNHKEDVMIKAMLNITQTTHDKLGENYAKDGENRVILSSWRIKQILEF